jgi:hypothetical protein
MGDLTTALLSQLGLSGLEPGEKSQPIPLRDVLDAVFGKQERRRLKKQPLNHAINYLSQLDLYLWVSWMAPSRAHVFPILFGRPLVSGDPSPGVEAKVCISYGMEVSPASEQPTSFPEVDALLQHCGELEKSLLGIVQQVRTIAAEGRRLRAKFVKKQT